MSEYSLTIDGAGVPAAQTFPVIDPATGEPFADCPDCTREQLDTAVGGAQRAFPDWRRDAAARRQAMAACAGALEAQAQELGALLCREQGKPVGKAIEEVFGAAYWLRETAKLELPVERLHEDAEQRIELHRKPVGVVGAITPWNFPIILAMWKIAPALLAGNTLVLKPSPFTPLSSLRMGEVLREVLPPGVLNVVSGGDALGAWVSEHPAVRKISFTGSVPTGKKIMAAAAPDLKRVTLELGGNDPAIVLRDADPVAIAERLFWGAFNNCGQICIAVKRVYVEEPVYRPLVDALAQRARSVVVGPGSDPTSEIGPINNRPQLERVRDLIESARRDGARFEAGGGASDRRGYFVEPAIVTGIEDGSRLVDEEQFGPVLPVIPVRDADDALARANRSHFGLGGSVWTKDVARGQALARELECGTGWVNQHGALSPWAPFGGSKWSGVGYENGPWGLAGFTELQVISTALG